MLNKLEQKLSTFVKRYFFGYEVIAILYKALMYLCLPKSTQRAFVAEAYKIIDVAPNLEGETFFGYYDRRVENSIGEYIFIRSNKRESYLQLCSPNNEIILSIPLLVWNYHQGAQLQLGLG